MGGLAALSFVALPAAAGVAAFAAAGGASGGIGYTADWAMNGADPKQWSWKGFAGSVAFGAVTAGAGGYVAPMVAPKIAAAWESWRGSGAATAEAGEAVGMAVGEGTRTAPGAGSGRGPTGAYNPQHGSGMNRPGFTGGSYP